MSTRPLTLASIALVTGGVAIGTNEFVAMGLLPNIASGLGIDIPTAGHSISAYAIGVVVGAPVISALTTNLPKRLLLMLLTLTFVVANIGTALSVNYGTLLLWRFLAGLPHGVFFGVAAVVAVDLARAGMGAKAVSRVMLGIPIANIAGVPAATAIGQSLGWRASYLLVAVLGVVTLALVRLLIPYIAPSGQNIRAELGALKRPQVWLAIAIGSIGFGGQFAMFSYITPLVTNVSGAQSVHVPWILLVFGVGGLVGTWLGGNFATRSLWGSMFGGLAGMTVLYVLLALTATSLPMTTLLVGLSAAAASSLTIGLQMRLMQVAGDAKTLGASLNHAALNMANALGAFLGGLAISAGWGWVAPTWVGAGLSAAGLAVAFISMLLARSEQSEPAAELNGPG